MGDASGRGEWGGADILLACPGEPDCCEESAVEVEQAIAHEVLRDLLHNSFVLGAAWATARGDEQHGRSATRNTGRGPNMEPIEDAGAGSAGLNSMAAVDWCAIGYLPPRHG